MQQLLNTLYVTTQGAYLRLDHDTVKVEVEGATVLQVPLHHIGRFVLFGNVLISPSLMHHAMDSDQPIALLDHNGRFKGRITGRTSGNVLLRRAQYEAATNPEHALAISKGFIAGKIENCRRITSRAAREAGDPDHHAALRATVQALADSLRSLENATTLDEARGVEGYAARTYYSTFNDMIRTDEEAFRLEDRNRRPPRDPVNALLSFLYTLLLTDCTAAMESVGLDPQVGFLHGLRPGKPAGGLDLTEEFRSLLADRTALSLINRRQLTPKNFDKRPGGAVLLNDEGRKTVLVEYQRRKQTEVTHPILEQQVPLGLAPHVQSQLLARHIRGDTQAYLPFTPK